MADPARDVEAELVDLIASTARDPHAFVRAAFPWGEGQLADKPGPDQWQVDIMAAVRDGLLTLDQAVQVAVASGHGVGKSALVAWLLLWAMSTHPDTRGVVTANTENQLRTKTWAELSKWYRLLICRHWFKLTATALYATDPSHEKTWRIDAVPWSENNTEAFAGLHNEGRRIIVVFDEASAIPDVIWETTEGALTDANTEILWLCFGNPTRNTGRFRECFGRYRHRWLTRQIDSRTVAITNKTQLQQWVADYGEDSDFVRVRVRGVFPRAGSMQFIPSDIAEEAQTRDIAVLPTDPFILGVDVARFGDDETIICPRKGRNARSYPWVTLRGADTMTVVGRVTELIQLYRPDAIFVDEGGVGAGVIDRLRQLRHNVIGINFGAKADRIDFTGEGVTARNKSAEMWANMREWLKGGAVPPDPALLEQLTGREYGFDANNAIVLEKKDDMKKRGLSSPDRADALALTFAYPVAASVHAGEIGYGGRAPAVQSDWDPYA